MAAYKANGPTPRAFKHLWLEFLPVPSFSSGRRSNSASAAVGKAEKERAPANCSIFDQRVQPQKRKKQQSMETSAIDSKAVTIDQYTSSTSEKLGRSPSGHRRRLSDSLTEKKERMLTLKSDHREIRGIRYDMPSTSHLAAADSHHCTAAISSPSDPRLTAILWRGTRSF